ncbi:hypothetical protein ACI2KR_06485 [Pseudomonas luteola]
MISLSIQYLGTCNSQYFQGFAGEVFAINCGPRPRKSEIKQALLGQISSSDLFCVGTSLDTEQRALVESFVGQSQDIDPTDSTDVRPCAYTQLKESVLDLFQGEDLRTRFSDFEMGDESYAYFGVKVAFDS